ncbi:hypothetical protein DXN05_15690 [Deminuibacter soli]|uniref:Uncharacterized protein n=1 Tax=Deminuibacter soli TaxID=2291815 RepID=A0A3E1NI48_9BACT|nr:hypothetical protein DXN05_15690 [Deminuibacter soli]
MSCIHYKKQVGRHLLLNMGLINIKRAWLRGLNCITAELLPPEFNKLYKCLYITRQVRISLL